MDDRADMEEVPAAEGSKDEVPEQKNRSLG